jgi:hypothetical protein
MHIQRGFGHINANKLLCDNFTHFHIPSLQNAGYKPRQPFGLKVKNRLDALGAPTESSLFQRGNELSSRAGQTVENLAALACKGKIQGVEWARTPNVGAPRGGRKEGVGGGMLLALLENISSFFCEIA